VFCEPYLATGRHVEVQVMADVHGTVWAVGERECSIQRRHQKVVEEAPSPLVERVDGMRKELFEAARAAARAIGYTGAGTVEFLADDDGRFFFLEMNTRLQVEHPVTECTTGLDLVALQLSVANGAALDPEPPAPKGHAIEVRLYAEDPAADWQPQSGTLHRIDVPGVDVEFGLGAGAAGVRLDSGVEDGTVVGIHYDPMLAKVITWAPTRAQAATALAAALSRARIHGVVTNRDLLVQVLRSEAFLAGEVSTAFLFEGLVTGLRPSSTAGMAAAAAIGLAERAGSERAVQQGVPVGWRNVPSQPQRTEFEDGSVVEWWRGRDGYVVDDFTVVAASPASVTLESDGVRTTYDVTISGETVDVDGPTGHARLTRKPRFTDPADAVASGSLLAPMPGTVVGVAVEKGAEVVAGQAVLVLEAMKMQHTVAAPCDGVVATIDVQPGMQVAAGDVLAVVEERR
jgi:propionyl-CoA carboxylase alpha chain